MYGALIMARESKKCNLYILDVSDIIIQTYLSSQNFHDKSKLLNLGLGHVSERGLAELVKQGFLGSEKLNKLEFCDYCILGKQHNGKFGSDMCWKSGFEHKKGVSELCGFEKWCPNKKNCDKIRI